MIKRGRSFFRDIDSLEATPPVETVSSQCTRPRGVQSFLYSPSLPPSQLQSLTPLSYTPVSPPGTHVHLLRGPTHYHMLSSKKSYQIQVTLIEVSQKKKNKYHMLTHIYRILKKKWF